LIAECEFNGAVGGAITAAAPAATDVTRFKFCTRTGALRWLLVPSPSSPNWLLPQAQSTPVASQF
jgi:hypothetical protein